MINFRGLNAIKMKKACQSTVPRPGSGQACQGTVPWHPRITHNEPEGNGARRRILEYEDDRSNKYREDLQTDNKHKRP